LQQVLAHLALGEEVLFNLLTLLGDALQLLQSLFQSLFILCDLRLQLRNACLPVLRLLVQVTLSLSQRFAFVLQCVLLFCQSSQCDFQLLQLRCRLIALLAVTADLFGRKDLPGIGG